MAEHHELVAEMPVLEQMGTQERQKLAKKRRLQQLKKWGQREKEWIAKEKQLNKRLANTLHEENNGLNLKQYTTYSSSHRSKKLQLTTATSGLVNGNSNGTCKSLTNQTNSSKETNGNTNNNNNTEFLNNNHNKLVNNLDITRFRASNGPPEKGLAPNGRVHFNVGVMLLEAAARNDFDEVKRLLMLGVSPDSVNHDGLTALHQCCIDASEPMMNLLLEFGANVDARDTEQWTPLHAACTCGHINLVRILVENGADLLAVNGDGNMPFDICEDEATLDYIETEMVKRDITQEMIDIKRASTEMQMLSDLEQLVADAKDLNMPVNSNDNGITYLHVAAANNYLSVVKFLIKHSVNLNACDNDLWRPLHGAACWGNEQHVKVIELLVEAGAQLDAKTVNDETVFDLCDNADLLERLNQLKDELESKQASGTDRLRRTQSRTNSRVHSVRRTSVRDKNQISRRDAREEALLRVENSPNSNQTAASSNGQPIASNANATATTIKSEQNEAPVSNGGNLSSESSAASIECQASLPVNPSICIDQVDGQTATHLTYQQTDLDQKLGAPATTNSTQPNGQGEQLSTPSQNCDKFGEELNKLEDDKRKQQVTLIAKINPLPVDDSLDNNNPTLGHDRDASKSCANITLSKQIPVSQDIKKTKSLMNEASRAQGLQKANNFKTAQSSNNNDTACDQNLNTQQQQVTQSLNVVQLAPINYTLSNLKKQRSDLRMRTTSIGGCSSATTTITVTSCLNGSQALVVGQQSTSQPATVLLNPQPVASSSNGLHRPESPSLTFRKFSGEPSEVIGSRRNRHKCCILI